MDLMIFFLATNGSQNGFLAISCLDYGIAWQYTLGRDVLDKIIDTGCIWRLVPAWSPKRTLPSRDGMVHGHVDRCDGGRRKHLDMPPLNMFGFFAVCFRN